LLKQSYKVLVTARVMKTVDKKGGFDNFLLDTSDSQLGSDLAVDLKYRLLQRISNNSRKAFMDPATAAGGATPASSSHTTPPAPQPSSR